MALTTQDSAPGVPVETLSKLAIAASALLFGLRFFLSDEVGYGDAEALYASYALFHQASYLDHPGLIGWVAGLIADNSGVPLAVTAHHFTAIAATTVPWLAGLAARACGASWRGTLLAIITLVLAPEIAIGLFAFTPDVPLAFGWLGALACAGLALRSEPSSTRAFAATVGAGLFTGMACMAKVSGVLLGLSLILTWLTPPVRSRLKTSAPYAALLSGLVCTLPLLLREYRLGFPMLHHRLIATQAGFGPSLRNLGALLGGQLLYVTPVLLVAAVLVAIDLVRRFRSDEVSRLLGYATFVPFVGLGLLCLLSKVAEPHWVAPAYLALVLHFARRVDQTPQLISRKLGIAAWATCALAIGLVYAVVRYPLLPQLLGSRYEARYDLINDLYVWKAGNSLVDEALQTAQDAGFSDITVVGPHWIVCAQVQAHLGNRVRVGCETDIGDDFQTIYPRSEWENAKVILYVTDDRFSVDVKERFPDRAAQTVERIAVRRGGAAVRTIRVLRLGKMGSG